MIQYQGMQALLNKYDGSLRGMIEVMQVSDQQFDQFIKTHPNGDMCQLTGWGKVKAHNGWLHDKVAVGQDGNILGAASLLFRKIPGLGRSLCYVSRGFVVDWHDKSVVEALLQAVKDVCQQYRAFVIKVDPVISEKQADILQTIESYGFKHQGFSFGLSGGAQPRHHMITDISLDEKALLKSFQSRTRTNVRKSQKYGFELEDAPIEKMSIFYNIMQVTGDRDDFNIRSQEYFEWIYQALNPTGDAKLFLVKLNPKEAIKGLEKDIRNKEKEVKRLQEKEATEQMTQQIQDIQASIQTTQAQITELQALQEAHPEGTYLSGSVYTQAGEKAYYLYGASSNEFRELMPNYFMQWEMMKYAKSQGATSYSFGAVSGMEGHPDDEAPGLFEFKKRWAAEKVSFIGEFDYVISPFWNNLFNFAMKIRK